MESLKKYYTMEVGWFKLEFITQNVADGPIS
jgi:hypothetical protein